jgi:DNA (cytosine-5)-methyltransferase 1
MVDGADRLRTLDLFSGIGGISLALGPWCRTVCYCEIDPYAVGVLAKEMARGNLDVAPVWSNIRTFGPSELAQVEWYAGGEIQAVTGGFPCQDISSAGKRAGIKGKQSELFFQQMRIIRMARPRIVFLENVRGITKGALAVVLGELADCGYDAKWRMLSAQEMGAPHKRDRWWCVAYPFGSSGDAGLEQTGWQVGTNAGGGGAGADVAYRDGDGCGGVLRQAGQGQSGPELGTDIDGKGIGDGGAGTACENVADAEGIGRDQNGSVQTRGQATGVGGTDMADGNGKGFTQRQREKTGSERAEKWDEPGGIARWAVEPDVGRVADGVPFRVDRLRNLGNAVVPSCARKAFELLMGMK